MRKTLLVAAVGMTFSGVVGDPSTRAAGKNALAFDVSSLDRSVDACTNFYEFACGGWRKANPIPGDQTRWGRFNQLADRNRDVLHEILEGAKDAAKKRTPVEAKVGDYYAACMDEAGIEAQGTRPLAPVLAGIDKVASRTDFFRLLGEHEASALPTLFGFGGAPDLHDSKSTIANVGQGGIGLPDRDDYLKEDAKSEEKRAKYVEHMTKMFELAGTAADQAVKDAQTVMGIETNLAKGYLDRVSMRDPKNRDNPMSLDELRTLAPAFDFDAFLKAAKAPAFTKVNVVGKPYFEKTNALIEATPLSDWKTYLRWHAIRAAAPYLGKAFVAEDFAFNRAYLAGAKEMEPRWKRCTSATDRALGEALGQIYVEKTFGKDGKARMKVMIDALTEALREDIQELPWMTAETKKKALVKLAAFDRSKVGYPEVWKDYTSVVVRRDDYLGNSRRARMFEDRRNMDRIGKATDKTQWGMTPPTVNAYYSAANNEIVFPAGILQPPFFDRDMDDAVNFGGIGVVIGHEYTHGFDDQGSKFGPDGNLENWWTPDDLKAFGERTACLARQYDGYVAVRDEKNGDIHLNGRLTLGENTGDNGGLNVAYAALQKTLAGKERRLIDGFTPEQRFFLGYANLWCQNSTEASSRQLAQTDPHSPGEFRVNGVVSNSPQFAKAFGCKAPAPMIRENACRVW
ncbi:MAG: M13 family metallopeptidase [Vicinamibacteria bacterium]|nr:M13 family metallopeptidase [Vicinamibacteria bacterium]